MFRIRVAAIILLLCLCATPASADMIIPYLYFDPGDVTIGRGQTTTINVQIQDADQLIQIDIRLQFDPAVIEIVDADPAKDGIQVSAGALPKPDFVIQNVVDNAGGSINYKVTQLNPTAPATGDGLVFSFQVRGKATGSQSPLDIVQANVIASDGSTAAADTEMGNVVVSADVASPTNTTIVATVTATATASRTPTATAQPQSTGTGTATPTTAIPTPTLAPSASPTATPTVTASASPTVAPALAAAPTFAASSTTPRSGTVPRPTTAVPSPPPAVPGGPAATATPTAAIPPSPTRPPATAVPPASAGTTPSVAAVASTLPPAKTALGETPLDPAIGQPLAMEPATSGPGGLDSAGDALGMLAGILMIIVGGAMLVGTIVFLRRSGIWYK